MENSPFFRGDSTIFLVTDRDFCYNGGIVLNMDILIQEMRRAAAEENCQLYCRRFCTC